MDKKIIVISIAVFVLGFGIGHAMSNSKLSKEYSNKNMGGGHVMPGGTMMDGSGSMSMGEMMEVMNAELKGKTGDDFDKAFLSEMIVHHEGAVEMAELALTNAKHKEIKDLSSNIIKAQEMEIAQMKAWLGSWYNN